VTWEEAQGVTENFLAGTSQPGRTMQVEILYPTLGRPGSVVDLAAPAYRFGPYPLVVFAHGYNVDPNTYRALLASWAGAGYVVAAPFFPDTSLPAVAAQQGADTESDMFNQPGDVAFVVSQVVAAAGGSVATHAAYLAGLVNPAQLILAGQSDGGDTVAALMYDKVYAATRASMPVKPIAVGIFSGAEMSRAADVFSAPPGGPPVLVVQSLTDACNYPANSSQLYNVLPGPKWFLAIDNSTHLGPYVGLGAAAAVVEQVTAGFFDLAAHRGRTSPALLGREGNRPGVSSLTNAPTVPSYPAPASDVDGCSLPPGAPTD
jgi:dienelactone hydrolase